MAGMVTRQKSVAITVPSLAVGVGAQGVDLIAAVIAAKTGTLAEIVRNSMASSSRRKSGYVYFGRSERKNGKVQEYVGSTTRNVRTREREHKREVRKKRSKTWVGKGNSFKVTDSFWSTNPRKAERTIKRRRRAAYKAGTYRSKYSGHKAKTRSSTRRKAVRSYRPKRSSRRTYRSRRR